MEIITLIKANLRHKKGSFISIMVLILIISTVLTSVISIKYNMKDRANQAHKAIDTGDFILYLENKQLTDDLVSKVEACNSVSKMRICKTLLMYNTSIEGEKVPINILIQGYDNDSYPYELFNEECNDFVTNKIKLSDKEILLPIAMKQSYSCKVGETLSFDIGTEKIDLTIAGFFEEPFTGSNIMGQKSLIVTNQLLNTIREHSHIEEQPENEYIWDGNLVHIYATDAYKNKIQQMSKEINKETNLVSLSMASITKEQSITFTLLITNILCGVLQAFVIILFFVVIRVLSNNINSSIEIDYTNIGILKSQGFTKLKIRLILLIQYLLTGVLGTLAGILLAIPLVHTLCKVFVNTSGLLFSSSILVLKSAAVLSIILLIMAAFILLKTRKVAKISPVNAISGGLENIYFKNVLQTPVIGKSRAFINLKLAFRQLTTNTVWYVGTCLIIGLLLAFLCLTASFNETFTEKYFKGLYGVEVLDVNVEYGDKTAKQEEVEATISSITPIENKIHSGSQYILVDQEQNLVQILDDTSYFRNITEGRTPKYDNEIIITSLVSSVINKKVGESVEIQYQDKKKDYIISGIYDSCTDLGKCIGMSLSGIRQVDPEYKTDSYGYILADQTKAQKVIDTVNDAYLDSENITAKQAATMNQNAIDSIMMGSDMVMLGICIISVIFVIIVICMICNKMFTKERQSLGIYKAFGFTATNLRFQYCFRFLFVALIGCVLGSTAFVLFGNSINSGIMRLAGITTYSAPVTWFNLGLPILLICLAVFLSSFVTMRKVKKVDVKALIFE